MTQRSLLRAGRIAACLAYILMASSFAGPVLAAPEVVAAPGAVPLPVQEIAPPAVTVNLETANPMQPVLAPLYWRLDKTGRVTPEEVLSPAQQSFFVPFPAVEMPKAAGTSWFRFTLAPYSGKNGGYYLDLNSRVVGQIPKGHRVWLLREGQPHIQLHTETPGLYLLPDSTVTSTVFVRTEGLPAVGFAPSLRNAATVTVLDTEGSFWVGILLAAALLFGLLRGIFEQREWRMWAALYAGTLMVVNAWGFPATPDGKVMLLDLPGLLAPGIALLLLPHVGRHILRSREHSAILDIQFILTGVLGLVLCLLPMLSNHVWTIRYLPLWPLGMLLLLPTTLQGMFKNINGSGRFMAICLLPPLGLLSFAPLPVMQFTSAEDAGLWNAVISLLPSLGLCASSLLIALAPTPRHEIKATRVAAPGVGLNMPGKGGTESPLRLEPKAVTLAAAPPLVLDDTSRMTPPADVDSALPLHNLERRMRGPLDVLLNEIGTLEQMNLPRDLVDHAHRLSRAGRQLSLLIGEISSGRHGSPVVVRQKSGMENAAQAHAAPFDLYDVILQSHNAVAELAEAKNLALSWFTAPHLARTYNGQGDRLLRVLTLLAESAVHATDRGIVQIRVQRLPESNDPGLLQFTVSDTGKGSPPLQRSSISLVQVWELVGPTGGTLNVESGPTGTSIAFSMRFQALSSEIATRSLRDATSPTLRTEMCNALRILVISDVPGSRQLLSYYLDELPHEVREARSVDEALGMYMQAPGALLIFDGDLPEADVVRAIAAIRAFEGEHGYPLSSILALVKDDEQIERLRRAGCTHSLLKPVSRTELRQLALRLAPIPRSRTPHKPEPPTAGTTSGTFSPSTTTKTSATSAAASAKTDAKPAEKSVPKAKSSWTLRTPLSLDQRAEPEATSDTARPGSLPLLAKSTSVSEPRPVPSTRPPLPEPLSSKRESAPAELTSKAPTQEQAVAPLEPAAKEFPAQTLPVAPKATSTAQILDEMVRDAEGKIAEDKISEPAMVRLRDPEVETVSSPSQLEQSGQSAPTTPRVEHKTHGWKAKHPQDTVRRAVDAASAERKPMPWPGSRSRRVNLETVSPYVPGNEGEWVSEPRPVNSTGKHSNDERQRAAIRVTGQSGSELTLTPKSADPRMEMANSLDSGLSHTAETPSGLVGSLLSVFKKKDPQSAPHVFSSNNGTEEWVGEPRPLRRHARDTLLAAREQEKPATASPSFATAARQVVPTPPTSQADTPTFGSDEWVGDPRPKHHAYSEPGRSREDAALTSSNTVPHGLHDPLAPVDFAEQDKLVSHAPQQKPAAEPAEVPRVLPMAKPVLLRKQDRKMNFQPLLLPGLRQDTPTSETSGDTGLELRFSTEPDTQEEIFTLTEIVDDSTALPELSQDSRLITHQPEPSPLYFDDSGTPQRGLREPPELAEIPDIAAPLPMPLTLDTEMPIAGTAANTDSAEEQEIATLRRLPGTPLADHPGLELVEFPDETPVEEQLERLETLSEQAQEAFARDDIHGLRRTAARLADTAAALGMHGLIDLAHCLEEVAGDPEATASLLETIEEAVQGEKG